MALQPPTTRMDITWQAGDDHPATIPAPGDDGQPRDLTGWSALVNVVDDGRVVHSWSTELRTARCGPDGIVLLADDSEHWTWRRGRYDARIVSPAGVREVPVSGRMRLNPLRSRRTA